MYFVMYISATAELYSEMYSVGMTLVNLVILDICSVYCQN